jgi:hypothetical protein
VFNLKINRYRFMKRQILKGFSHGCWMLAVLFLSVSCEESFMPQSKTDLSVTAKSSANAEMVAASQAVMDITSAGMVNQGISYGRAAEGDSQDDDHLCGATVTKTITLNNALPDSLILEGNIIIDFGDGMNCEDASDHRASGSITTEFTIHMNVKTHQYTSIETITLDAFSRGSKTLSGSFIARAASGGQRWLEIIDAELTYVPHDAEDDEEEGEDDEGDDDNDEEAADTVATTIYWSGSLTFAYDNGGTFSKEDDTKTVTGSMEGHRNGSSFISEITTAVLFDYGCDRGRYPVSGTVAVTAAGVLTTVDFGSGGCDTIYTSTTAGVTSELHFKG